MINAHDRQLLGRLFAYMRPEARLFIAAIFTAAIVAAAETSRIPAGAVTPIPTFPFEITVSRFEPEVPIKMVLVSNP